MWCSFELLSVFMDFLLFKAIFQFQSQWFNSSFLLIVIFEGGISIQALLQFCCYIRNLLTKKAFISTTKYTIAFRSTIFPADTTASSNHINNNKNSITKPFRILSAWYKRRNFDSSVFVKRFTDLSWWKMANIFIPVIIKKAESCVPNTIHFQGRACMDDILVFVWDRAKMTPNTITIRQNVHVN